jgi:hypothetical protein
MKRQFKRPENIKTLGEAMDKNYVDPSEMRDDTIEEEAYTEDTIVENGPEFATNPEDLEFDAIAPSSMEIDWDNFKKISELENVTSTILDVKAITTKFGNKLVLKLTDGTNEFFMYGPSGLSNIPYYFAKGEVTTVTPYKTVSKKSGSTYWTYKEKPVKKSDIVSIKDLKGKSILVHAWEKKNTKFGEKYLAYFRYSMEEEKLQKTFFPISYANLLDKITSKVSPEYIKENGVKINIK